MEIIFHEQSLSDILCSELIHPIFLKNLRFILQSMSHSVCLIQGGEGVSFQWRRERFFSKANKQFQLKKKVHATCLTSNLPNMSIARQFIRLNSFICLTHHLSANLKIQNKFSPTTHYKKFWFHPSDSPRVLMVL